MFFLMCTCAKFCNLWENHHYAVRDSWKCFAIAKRFTVCTKTEDCLIFHYLIEGLKFRCIVWCVYAWCLILLCLKWIILTFACSLAHDPGFFVACGQIFGYGSISTSKGNSCLILGSRGDSHACVQNGIMDLRLVGMQEIPWILWNI